MGSKISPLLIIILLYSVFFLQYCLQTTHEGHVSKKHDDDDDHKSLISLKTPELNVFFNYNTLKLGMKLPIYFPITTNKDPNSILISRHESNSIPFSTSQFPHILTLFSFPETSKQALAMKTTLHHCESPPIKGETKFCATSLESMLDSVRAVFGFHSGFRVVTTNIIYLSGSTSPSSSTPLQNYTVIEPPVEIPARRIVACHLLPYPYAVFYCHSQAGSHDHSSKLYKVLLEREDGSGRVEAAAICHMDTAGWDPHHMAFRVLETWPGGAPVCHFFPDDSLVWIPLHGS